MSSKKLFYSKLELDKKKKAVVTTKDLGVRTKFVNVSFFFLFTYAANLTLKSSLVSKFFKVYQIIYLQLR